MPAAQSTAFYLTGWETMSSMFEWAFYHDRGSNCGATTEVSGRVFGTNSPNLYG